MPSSFLLSKLYQGSDSLSILDVALGIALVFFLRPLLHYISRIIKNHIIHSKSKSFSYASSLKVTELPNLSSSIPYLGHLLGLQLEGSHYLNRLILSTPNPIFTLNLLFKKIVVVNPSLDRYLARHVSDTGLAQILADVGSKVFDLSDKTIQIIHDVDPRPLHKFKFGDAENLRTLTQRSSEFIWSEVTNMPQVQEVDFARWLFGLTVSATAAAVWGAENPWNMDREFAAEFMTLSETFDTLSWPMPWLTSRKAYKARESLNRRLKAFHAQHRASRIRSIAHGINVVAQSDPDWETNPDYFNIEMVSALGLLATPSTLSVWLIRHLLATPNVLSLVLKEVQELDVVEFESEARPRPDLRDVHARCPWLVASWYETLRLHMTAVPRVARHEFNFDAPGLAPLSVSEGDILLLPMCASNLDAAIWGPNAEAFSPGRFITQRGELSNSLVRKVKSFGVAGNLCPGRVFGFEVAMAIITGTLKVFEIRKMDGEPWTIPAVKKGLNVGFERYASDDEVVLEKRCVY